MSQDLQKAFGYFQESNENGAKEGNSDDAENDDFGDFEEPVQTTLHDQTTAESGSRMGSKGASTQAIEWRNIVSENIEQREQGVFSANLDEDWGDFVDNPQQRSLEGGTNGVGSEPHDNPSVKRAAAASNPREVEDIISIVSPTASVATESRTAKQAIAPIVQAPPPSNIPPPSTLLLLIATLLQTLPAELKVLLAGLKSPVTQPIDIDQANVDEVKLRISFIRAIARIIAGRKLRWKRDTHLSQSMKIGPASAGRLGGMKLTGIDRTESRREDQEAAEVVQVWQQHVGSLRAGVASAKSHIVGLDLAVPEIAENMSVKVGKLAEGALTAPRCCVLCGLKREERVEKVDVNVLDSFGEWWTEHWGHLDCQRFWEKHESSLQQRR
ncbi:hypothetical protein G7Y79_00004g012650 [Physcia stellaris]|nr:hypothetical protein G7Y79_00004g012650 [Physcia stellaris]